MSDTNPEAVQADAPQITADDLFATIDELRAQNESLTQRTVLLNKEIRFRDQKIQQLSAQLAENAGFKEGEDGPQLQAVPQPPQQ